jgi:CRISPR-associated protein Csb2
VLPAVLSGHQANGTATQEPHIAFVPLPFVGHPHADASLMGIAIVLPRGIAPEARRQLFRLVADLETRRRIDSEGTLSLAPRGGRPLVVRRIDTVDRWTLRPITWSRPAKRFVTATPIALDRIHVNLRSHRPSATKAASINAQRTISNACLSVGLPEPHAIEISFDPLLVGAEHVRSHGPYPRLTGRLDKVLLHATMVFREVVRGPVIVGAGRYFGLGLCLPVDDESLASEDEHVATAR